MAFTPLSRYRRNSEKVTKIVSTLNLKIPPRELNSKDSKQLLTVICAQWLSLSSCVIQAIVDVVPSPSVAQRIRVPKMLYPDIYESTVEPKNKMEENLYSCDARPEAYVVALVSKMFAIPAKELPGNKRKPLTADEMRARAKASREARVAQAEAANGEPAPSGTSSTLLESALEQMSVEDKEPESAGEPVEADEVLLGFARIYSGTIRTGTTISCVLPKYTSTLEPTHPRNAPHVVTTKVEALYVMMGRELVPVDQVHAGNVFAVQGLEGKVWRSATLCAPGEQGLPGGGGLGQGKDCLLNLGGVFRYVGRELS